eukprot:scaffold1847_cov131-Isochrysis_galbana.AAC.3
MRGNKGSMGMQLVRPRNPSASLLLPSLCLSRLVLLQPWPGLHPSKARASHALYPSAFGAGALTRVDEDGLRA